jgi:hypothetical protein
LTLGSPIVDAADKATHISQLESLGRHPISCDIMPLQKRNLRTDGHGLESENATPTTRAQREQVNDVRDKADTEAGFHASHLENSVSQVVHDFKPLVTKVPKTEPVEEVCPPKESKRIRRKTTLRREGRDDFLQVTLGEPTNWQLQGSQYNRQENLVTSDVHKKAQMTSEMTTRQFDSGGVSRDLVSSTHRSLELISSTEDLQENNFFISGSNHLSEASTLEADHLVRNSHVSATTDCPALDKLGSDTGVHWLKPKPEPVNGGDGVLVMAREGNYGTENGNLKVVRPDQGEGTLVKLDTTTQFKQVFFGSIFDKVGSEVGAHHSDAERKRHRYMELGTALETRDHANRWQCLPEMVLNSTADVDVQADNNKIPWLNHPSVAGQTQIPASEVKQMPDGRQEEEINHDSVLAGRVPNEADLNATHVYMNGF